MLGQQALSRSQAKRCYRNVPHRQSCMQPADSKRTRPPCEHLPSAATAPATNLTGISCSAQSSKRLREAKRASSAISAIQNRNFTCAVQQCRSGVSPNASEKGAAFRGGRPRDRPVRPPAILTVVRERRGTRQRLRKEPRKANRRVPY